MAWTYCQVFWKKYCYTKWLQQDMPKVACKIFFKTRRAWTL